MTKTPARRYRILVVDDEPTVCQAVRMLLEFSGHEVQTATCGEAALVLLEKSRFDVVFTDYSMQGMNGDELVALIKQRRTDQPVIMATAFIEEVRDSNKLCAGVDFLLSKPFSMADLQEAISRVLPAETQT